MGSGYWVESVTGSLATVYIAQHELARAAAALEAVGEPGAPVRSLGRWLVTLARAQLALARGEPRAALDLLGRLEAATPAGSRRTSPRVQLLRAAALDALGESGEAEAAYREVRDATEVLGLRPLLWRAHVALGRLYQAQRRPAEAEQAFARARAVIAELAEAVPERAPGDEFLREASALLPFSRAASPLRAAKAVFGGLTAREREVAALIAHGHSNRAIADALSVSERTVETHVSNILPKLGFAARSQIAAWAAERHLAPPSPGSPAQRGCDT